MGMDEIWEQLAPETRDWLVANNGDAVPTDIAAEIDELVEAVGAENVWAVEAEADAAAALDPDDDTEVDDEDSVARYLVEDAIDWIEGFANDE